MNALKSLIEAGFVQLSPHCAVMPNVGSNLDNPSTDYIVQDPVVLKRRMAFCDNCERLRFCWLVLESELE